MSGVSVYIATHKPVEMATGKSCYKRILVGAALDREVPEGYERDDAGTDNISAKNASYCELTGIYWIWKHSTEKIVGLGHYRRYFYSSLTPNRFHDKLPSRPLILGKHEIKNALSVGDIILPEPYLLNQWNCRTHYEALHNGADLDVVREVLEEKYPEYVEDFDVVMGYKLIYYANMMICKKKLFDAYCEWLFDVLFEVERRIDIEDYDDYQKRVFGFLSERLLNIWVRHNKLKVEERPVFDPSDFKYMH